MKAVVCDDDPTVRSVITALLEELGHEVIAETDSGPDAVELVCRFGADLLVLDLSLVAGTGYEVVRAVSDRRPGTIVVVFTAFARDPDQERSLLAAGARAVLHKPDFARLEEVLVGVESSPSGERRAAIRELPPGVRRGPRSPGGVDPEADFERGCGAATTGDVALVAAVDGAAELAEQHGPGWVMDVTAELARAARRTLRVQDLVHVAGPGVVQALVLLGQAGVAEKIAGRFRRAWDAIGSVPVHLAWSEVDADGGGAAAVERAWPPGSAR